ncbi:hypothetical protein Q4Q49_05025 [Shewanella sp. SP1S1-7]|uniref:hypothetical protein n=1 Tax=Shewanella sp. SP1S1-7 TaxID=3063536 RepID=UPI002890CD9F|nr:hypothetical protein [Shewanella sp. SP1S1-7]MDT3334654.1 hypothetical protein [Shewanella sp. SP1S1-7]
MADLTEYLKDLDIMAVPTLGEKLAECKYFYDLLKEETDQNKFRWLLGAFLNSSYGYLEFKASYLHYGFCHPETGEPLEDCERLEALTKYVNVKRHKKSGFIKTSALSELMAKLYKFRNRSTHDGGIEVMVTGSDLPADFKIGKFISKGVPALKFCEEILSFFEELEAELD